MWTAKKVLENASVRSKALKRGLLAIAAITIPSFMAMMPAQAAAQTSAPLQAVDPASTFFVEYLPFSGASAGGFSDIFSHVVARDLMIGLMLAIAVAMVAGASYLWRENVSHLEADANRKKRRAFDIS